MTRRVGWFGIALVTVFTLGAGLAFAKDTDKPREHHKRETGGAAGAIIVYVKVIDPSGNPVNGAHVIFHPNNDHNTIAYTGDTGTDGIALMNPPPPPPPPAPAGIGTGTISASWYCIEVAGANGIKCNTPVLLTKPYGSALRLQQPF